MEKLKGFSLIEVLISLVLTTSVAFILLDFQSNNFLLLSQYTTKNHVSTLLDTIDEELLLGVSDRFKPVDPYTLHIEQKSEELKLQILGTTLNTPSRVHFLARA